MDLQQSKKLETVRDMIGGFTSGVSIATECDEAFPNNPDSELPITPVGSSTPEDKYGNPGFDNSDTSGIEMNRRFIKNALVSYKIDFWNADSATAPAQEESPRRQDASVGDLSWPSDVDIF